MRTFRKARPFNARRLHEALVAAHPTLAPRVIHGLPTVLFAITEDDAGVAVHLPDDATDVPDSAVQTALTTHDPTPDPVPPVPDYGPDGADVPDQLATVVQNLRAYLALSSPTSAQTVAALKLTIRVVLYLLRRFL